MAPKAELNEPAETVIPLPKAIKWSVIGVLLSAAVTATWQARGYQEELRAVREASDAAVVAQGRTDARVSKLEREFDKLSIYMEYVMKSVARQEQRAGYTPPPIPTDTPSR